MKTPLSVLLLGLAAASVMSCKSPTAPAAQADAKPAPAEIVATLFVHIRLWLRPATLAWPLWPFALWGLIQLFRQKPVAHSSWFIFLWLFVVYTPYAGVILLGVTRALAVPYDQGWGFFIPSRYLFPFTFPYVWVLAPLLARWLKGWSLTLVGLYMAANAWFFWQVLAR